MMYIGSLGQVVNESNDEYIASIMVNEAVYSYIDTGSTYLLESLADGRYDIILEELTDQGKAFKDEANKMTKKEFIDRESNKDLFSKINFLLSGFKKDEATDDITLGQLTSADAMHKYRNEKSSKAFEQDKEEGLWAMAKRAFNKGRDFVARLIGKLNSWMRKIHEKEISEGKLDPSKLGFFANIRRTITSVIEWLTRKLHNFIQKNRGDISKYQYVWDDSNKDQPKFTQAYLL